MRIKEYIEDIIHKLEDKGHREFQFLSASNCTLRKNGTLETHLFETTSLDMECYEIKLNEIEDGSEVPGSKLRIWSIPKRKRKGVTSEYYVALQSNNKEDTSEN